MKALIKIQDKITTANTTSENKIFEIKMKLSKI